MADIRNCTIESVAMQTSRKAHVPEVLFRAKETGTTQVWAVSVSFSGKVISSGRNEGRVTAEASRERLLKALGLDPKESFETLIKNFNKFVGKTCRVVVEPYTNPETRVTKESADAIIFDGETPPTMEASEWLALVSQS